ncbi:intermembrane transport protein PqiB [Maritimibacter sp. DP1N21-5]|uniref:PqiB family protein n=1 Tax=Maritimibacter sp. DP1N21-5 TaxID=2836867 RepID=UPI001C46389C|nr:MlaD family protein [Maritimibacter sp. DP1N21-5]MBV7410403.1 MCE family protein [Maritimibacter sp. DP1N21-5]
MSDNGASDMTVSPRKRTKWRNLSLIWAVPLIALGVTLFVAVQTWSERGSLIQIRLTNAQGIVPDESTLRYRDVVVGVVERVTFTEDLSSILVNVRVDRSIADSLPPDAQFWVVRPQISAAGVQGLNTVLSGVYLEVSFTPQEGAAHKSFVGLDDAPLISPGEEGLRIVLRASDASDITAGAPISYRGIEVGRIETPRLVEGSTGVVVDAFIEQPYDKLLTTATRFWVTSGISVGLGPGGVDLSIGSVANLVRGGLAFDTVFSGGIEVADGASFDLFEDEQVARSSVFADTMDNGVAFSVEFDENVTGLIPGSQVMYRGVRVGTVDTITAYVVEQPGAPEVRLRATLLIAPNRMGLDTDADEAAVYDFFQRAVAGGLRAQLGWQSLFSQQLIVDLVQDDEGAEAVLEYNLDTPPTIPTIASDLPDFGATAEGLLARVDNLPVEELIEQVIATLAAVETFTADGDLRDAPGEFVALMQEARGIVGSEGAQALPEALNDAVVELTAVTEQLRSADAVSKVLSALQEIEVAAGAVTTFGNGMTDASDQLTQLLVDFQALTQKATALPIEEFLASAEGFIKDADELISSPGMQAVPESLSVALDEARAAISDIREGDLIDNANAAMASASDAAAAVEEAAGRLPSLAERIERVVAEAERVVASYSGNSEFNRETVASLREVRAAAEALSKLARAIERNPNSLLFGR